MKNENEIETPIQKRIREVRARLRSKGGKRPTADDLNELITITDTCEDFPFALDKIKYTDFWIVDSHKPKMLTGIEAIDFPRPISAQAQSAEQYYMNSIVRMEDSL